MSKVAVFGAGYVGLVTGACLAELGHDVVVRDVLAERVERLRAGEVPIWEPGLEELLRRNAERLTYTLDVGEAVSDAEFLYVAVGTPPTYSGDADLSAVWTVVDELGGLDRRAVLVMKSTVPGRNGRRRCATASTSAGSIESATPRIPSSPPKERRSATSSSRTGS